METYETPPGELLDLFALLLRLHFADRPFSSAEAHQLVNGIGGLQPKTIGLYLMDCVGRGLVDPIPGRKFRFKEQHL